MCYSNETVTSYQTGQQFCERRGFGLAILKNVKLRRAVRRNLLPPNLSVLIGLNRLTGNWLWIDQEYDRRSQSKIFKIFD